MAIDQAHCLCRNIKLLLRSEVNTDAVNSGQIELHGGVCISTLKPSIEEAPVDLLDLNYHHILDVFMYDEFC